LNNPLHPGGGPLNNHSITREVLHFALSARASTTKNPEKSHAQGSLKNQ